MKKYTLGVLLLVVVSLNASCSDSSSESDSSVIAQGRGALDGARYEIPHYQPSTFVRNETDEFIDEDSTDDAVPIVRRVWHFTSKSKPEEIKAYYKKTLPHAEVGEWDLRDDENDETGEIIMSFEYKPTNGHAAEKIVIDVFDEPKNGLARFRIRENSLNKAEK